MPKRRCAVVVLDVDEMGVVAKFQSQTFKAARFLARKRVGPKDVGSVNWDSSVVLDFETDVWPSVRSGRIALGAARSVAGRYSRQMAPGPVSSAPPPGDSGSLPGIVEVSQAGGPWPRFLCSVAAASLVVGSSSTGGSFV